jgi:hypothetical protein
MTYTEHQEFSQIEKTCEEVRKENEDLRFEILGYRHQLEEILTLNSMGKTKLIADRINAILK